MLYNKNVGNKIKKRSFENMSFNNKSYLYESNEQNKSPCVFCANCGGVGHIYKNCNYPITSYGVICFRLVTDKNDQCIYPEYLMVQRKDSLNFIEFIRGKYELKQRNYIMKMFQNMTEEERQEILNLTFPQIWMKLWKVDHCRHFEKEFKESQTKFDLLKKGYFIDRGDTGLERFDVKFILDNTVSLISESEWGFPKGRRNINESDISCAMREFHEETSMKMKYLKVDTRAAFEEIFLGTNKVRYKHVYYLANCPSNLSDKHIFNTDIRNKITDIDEIKNIKWFRYNDGQKLIREQNSDRKELFRKINQIVLKNVGTFYNRQKFVSHGK